MHASAATCIRLAEDFTLFDWNNASRWDCGFVPGPTDVAVIPGQTDFFDPVANIALNEDITLAGFVMEGGRIEGAYTITVTDVMTWSGGDLHYTNTAPFISPSVVVIAPGATLNVQIDDSIMTSAGTFINEGVTIWRTGTYTFSPPTITGNQFINNGDVTATAANGNWNTGFTNNGTLLVKPAGVEPVDFGAIDNLGNLTIENGTLGTFFEQITGTTTLKNGTLKSLDFDPMQLKGGRITGSGTINGRLNNSGGTLAPAGLLRMIASSSFEIGYTQGVSGTLEMSIGGLQRGSQYSSLTLNARANISGTLDVNFTNGFTPTPDDGFVIVDCVEACEGEFATNTSALTINYGPTLFSLGAEVGLPDPLRIPYILRAEEFQR